MSNKAQTKFPALAIGQHFTWRGRAFVKTSPLLACAQDTGQSQMIPRSAVVEVAEQAAAKTVPAADPARRALEHMHQAALAAVETLAAEAGEKTVTRVRRELDAAYRRAVQLLDRDD
jgi:hypothetical protein